MSNNRRHLEILCSTLVFMTGNDHDIMRSYVSSMVDNHDGVDLDPSVREECLEAQDTVVAILRDISPGFEFKTKAQIIEDAQAAFWQVIAKGFPVKETGYDIDATMKFQAACENAVESWLENAVI